METAQAAAGTDALTAFHWEPQPKAAAFVRRVVDDFLQKLPEAAAFAERLYRETGNRFVDLVEGIELGDDDAMIAGAEAAGWQVVGRTCYTMWQNPAGQFPRLCSDFVQPAGWIGIHLKVESVVDFCVANDFRPEPEVRLMGDPGSHGRLAILVDADDGRLGVSQNRSSPAFDRTDGSTPPALGVVAAVAESFRLRDRVAEDDGAAFDQLDELVDDAIDAVGRDVACDLFFAAEREYWQRRNAAARFQKARQDALGIGWANHDHHTYRSSRRHFHRLVALWEKLGFECRERFYPGPAAGWGAQVMEQPVCGIVTFNDVDISPDELSTDFAHEPMQDRDKVSTVGLWCGLHGESVLQAGMHHLECTFDFDALKQQMETEGGIATMPKFSDFPHLKQAFTKGERWPVEPARIDALLAKGLVTAHQAMEFRQNGAIGSHLENLERNDGFKGFNQTGVTDIIKATDPRHQG